MISFCDSHAAFFGHLMDKRNECQVSFHEQILK